MGDGFMADRVLMTSEEIHRGVMMESVVKNWAAVGMNPTKHQISLNKTSRMMHRILGRAAIKIKVRINDRQAKRSIWVLEDTREFDDMGPKELWNAYEQEVLRVNPFNGYFPDGNEKDENNGGNGGK